MVLVFERHRSGASPLCLVNGVSITVYKANDIHRGAIFDRTVVEPEQPLVIGLTAVSRVKDFRDSADLTSCVVVNNGKLHHRMGRDATVEDSFLRLRNNGRATHRRVGYRNLAVRSPQGDNGVAPFVVMIVL